jgi:hypothetical protein
VIIHKAYFKKQPYTWLYVICFLIFAPAAASVGKSEVILNQIFGQVAGLGSLTDKKSVMGDIFRIVNVSIAIFAGMVASITVYQGVVQTAAQGVFMGKRGSQSSFFTVFRTLSGLALVMPIYSGYSVLQYGVMSIALQSITVADNISEIILATPQAQVGQLFERVLDLDTIQANQQESEKERKITSSVSGEKVKTYYAMLADIAYCSVENKSTVIPRAEINGETLVFNNVESCGKGYTLQIENPQLKDVISKLTNLTLGSLYNEALINKTSNNNPSTTDKEKKAKEELAKEELAKVAVKIAKRDAPAFVLPTTKLEGGSYTKDWIQFPWHYTSLSMGCPLQDPSKNYTACVDSFTDLNSAIAPSDVSDVSPSQPYITTKMIDTALKAAAPSVSASQSSTTDISKFSQHFNQLSFNDIDPKGGQVLSSWNNPTTSGVSIFKQNTAIQAPLQAVLGDTLKIWYDAFYVNVSAMLANPPLELGKLSISLSSHMTMFMFTIARDVMSAQIKATLDTYWVMFALKIRRYAVEAWLAANLEYQWDIFYCLNPFAPNSSTRVLMCPPTLIPYPPPMMIGPNPVWAAAVAINMSTIAIMSVQYAVPVAVNTAIEQTTQLHWSLISQASLSSQYQGIIIASISPLMVLTNVLSIWLPLLPSLTYYVAVIGWVLAVVEAMVAFPLTALGMSFPQGHDFLGSAQQSLILLLSLFIRAPLIVIGFYIGMQLISAGMAGILLALNNIFQPMLESPSVASAVALIATMVMVIYISATLITYCLSAAYRIPSMVIRWVGAQADTGSEQQSIQRIYSLLNQQQGSALSSVQQSAQSAEQGGQAVSGQMRVQ